MKNFLYKLKQPRKREIDNFVAWARKRAVTFDSLEGAHTDIEKLSFLDELLEDKRIVYLGEEDHWIREKNSYRLLLLRYLFSRGWRRLGEELGWSDGMRINRYIETGERTHLNRVSTYGYRGTIREDRDDGPTGILKETSTKYPTEAFASTQIRLAEALRKLNVERPAGSTPLYFFGFDLDVLAGGGYEDLAGMLLPVIEAPAAAKLQALLARPSGESLEQEIARLERVLEEIDAGKEQLKELLGPDSLGLLRESAQTLRQSFDFIRMANPARTWEQLNRAMAAREEAMYRRVRFILSQMEPGEKLILMGHNRHLAKESDAIKNAGGAPPGGKKVPSLGTMLNRLLPGEVFSIWMLHDRGSSSQPLSWLSSEYSSPPGSLNAMLAEVGPYFLLPTVSPDPRARLLGKPLQVNGIYNQVFRTAVARQADAVFFVRRVNPLRVDPGAEPGL